MVSAVAVAAAVVLGLAVGSYLLKPALGPYPNYAPRVKLVYLYLRVYNTTVPVGGRPANVTLASFMAVVELWNTHRGTYLLPTKVAVHIPQQAYCGASVCGGGGVRVVEKTSTSASIIGEAVATTTIIIGNGSAAGGERPPNGSIEVVKYYRGSGFSYGYSNDILLERGVTHIPSNVVGENLPYGSAAYVTLSCTVPLPQIWARSWFSGRNPWLHGSSWAFVIIVVNGKALGGNAVVKGTSNAVLVLKVRLKHSGSEYWYGSIPPSVLIEPSEELVPATPPQSP